MSKKSEHEMYSEVLAEQYRTARNNRQARELKIIGFVLFLGFLLGFHQWPETFGAPIVAARNLVVQSFYSSMER